MKPRVPFWSSLRVRVLIGVVVPLTLVLAVAALVQFVQHRELMFDNLEQFSASIGESMVANLTRAMLQGNRDELAQEAHDLALSSSIRNLMILDKAGVVRVASRSAELGTQLPLADPTCQICHQAGVTASSRSVVLVAADGSRVFRNVTPIRNDVACQSCHGTKAALNGVLVVDLPYAGVEANLWADLRASILLSIAAIVLVSIAINLLLSRIVLSRLERFRESLLRYTRGDFSARVPVTGADELDDLARTVNGMAIDNARLYAEMEDRVKDLSRRVQHLAVSEERVRLAREMHDGFAQALSVLNLKLQLAQGLDAQDGNITPALAEMGQIVDEAYEDVRQAIGDLRTPLGPDGSVTWTLAEYVQNFALRYDLQAQVDVSASAETARCSPDAALQVVRIVQEVLTNVRKHAHAQNIGMRLERQNGCLTIHVCDDGQGFTGATAVTPAGHFGLAVMRERAASFGGELRIESEPGAGTAVTLRVPTVA